MGQRSYSPVRRAFYYCSNLDAFNATRTRVNWAIYNKEFEKNRIGKSGTLHPRFWHICLVPYKNRATALNNAVGIIPESFGGPLGCGPQGSGICRSVREQPRQKQIPDYDTRE